MPLIKITEKDISELNRMYERAERERDNKPSIYDKTKEEWVVNNRIGQLYDVAGKEALKIAEALNVDVDDVIQMSYDKSLMNKVLADQS